jgi:TRAP-type C4-dicarboxylate transport system substrate-binding protein
LSKRISVLWLCWILLTQGLFLPTSGYAAKRYLIKFATVAPEGSTWMLHMRRLDRQLRQETGDRLGFKLYPGGIAGDELDVLRKIRIGQIHAAAFSGVGLSQILPKVRVLDLPFLFRNDREIDLTHVALRSTFSDDFRNQGFEHVAWGEVGNVHLFSRAPIRKVEDVAGLKIWTWSGDPISKETFSVMGTNPIPLSIIDVTTALNTGMIDTVYAPPLGALALQWYLKSRYMTSLPLAHATGAVLISCRFFDKLPKELTEILKHDFEIAMAELTTDLRRQTVEAVRAIRESGVDVLPIPPPSELKAFYEVHDQVAQRLAGRVYPRELLNRIYAILKQARTP